MVKKTTIVNFLYFINMFTVFVLESQAIDSIVINHLSTILKFGTILGLIFLITVQKNTYFRWMYLILFALFQLIVFRESQSTSMLLFFLFLFGSKGINLQLFLKRDLYIRISILFFVFSLYLLGIFPDIILFRDDGAIRHSLGFKHPNTLGGFLLIIVIEIIIVNWEKLKWHHYLLSVILLLINNSITNSRTSFIVGIFSLLIAVSIKFKGQTKFIFNNWIFKWIVIILPFILVLFMLFVVKNLDINSTIFSIVNKFSSGRLGLFKNIYETYGVSLFGQSIPTLSEDYAIRYFIRQQTLDNAYLTLLIRYGILTTIVFSFYVSKIIKGMFENSKLVYFVLVLSFLFLGIAESFIIRPEMSLLCIMGSVLFNEKKEFI